MSDQLIPLDEIAQVSGRKPDRVRAECAALGFVIAQDWARRPAIGVDDAAALIDGSAWRVREHDDAWSAHLQACAEWEGARSAAVRQAADDAESKAARRASRLGRLPGVGGPLSPAEVIATRQEAGNHAGDQFERRNPRPDFNGSRDAVALMYVDESEEGSVLAVAVAAVRGPIKNGTEVT